ncbi:hypothetical protein GIB67_042069 [Kingdonia uniflora]|uniref:Uncharacterized protein n=1 Tax=Kingdonia uniflora TaxID=39325 RepID=A0A7J7MWC2_9MAGN|nr:hypothetical protein GIB67_042069 [Kingdonia uniflora]
MSIPAPIPPMYQDLSEEKAAEAEEDFYYKWIFHIFVLTGKERWVCPRTLAKDRVRASYAGKGVKSTVERKESMLDEVVEETKLELVLEGLCVARLVKGIWLGIEEEKSELMKENVELEKELAQSRTNALKEARQLKASHAVAIGQLEMEIKANLDEMVEERDRLGR